MLDDSLTRAALVVRAPEELDSSVGQQLAAELARGASSDHLLVVDFRATRSCDVTALQTLLQLAVALTALGAEVEVRSASPLLRDLVRAAGLARACR